MKSELIKMPLVMPYDPVRFNLLPHVKITPYLVVAVPCLDHS